MAIHIHLPARQVVKTKDTVPEYTYEQVMKKIREGEWESENDVAKGKFISIIKYPSKQRIMIRVKDAIGQVFSTLAEAKSEVANLEKQGIKAKVNQEVDEATKKMYFTVVRLTKDADWSAKHMGNFRFEVTAPDGKKTSVQANTSAEAIEKVKKGTKDAGEKFYVKNMSGQVVKTFGTKFEAQKYISEHQSERLHIYTTAKDASFIEVLNNPEGKRIVEQIEEITESLRRKGGKKGVDPELERIAAKLVAELKKKFNYNYGSFYP